MRREWIIMEESSFLVDRQLESTEYFEGSSYGNFHPSQLAAFLQLDWWKSTLLHCVYFYPKPLWKDFQLIGGSQSVYENWIHKIRLLCLLMLPKITNLRTVTSLLISDITCNLIHFSFFWLSFILGQTGETQPRSLLVLCTCSSDLEFSVYVPIIFLLIFWNFDNTRCTIYLSEEFFQLKFEVLKSSL